jgi:hypothetical protein
MTNNEFNLWLDNEFAKYPTLAKSNPKSVNELVYVLRMSEFDFCINTNDGSASWGCIPSVKEAFIPTRMLAPKIKSIEYDEETFEDMGIHLIMMEVEG